MESFELDIVLNNSRPVLGFNAVGKQDSFGSNSSRGSKDSLGGGSGSFNLNNSAAEEAITKVERELKDDIRFLLKAINHRDNVLSASRRAFQKLHRECKKAAQLTLLRIADKEQEQADQRRAVLDKLQQSVRAIDTEADENEFIESYSGRDGALMLSAQALTLLGDLVQPPVPDTPLDSGNHGTIKPGMYTYADMGAIDARSESVRSESPQVRRTHSTDSLGNPHGRSPPASPIVNKTQGRSFTTSSASTQGKGAATSTPPTNRFSFRRTLGLRSDSPPPPVSTPVSTSSQFPLPELPHYIHAPIPVHAFAHAATSAVVAGGKVGGGDINATSLAAMQADFTTFLTQIFYPPGTATDDRSSTNLTQNAHTNKTDNAVKETEKEKVDVKSLSIHTEPAHKVAISASESCESAESPRTPKILIDDNYFRHPATPEGEEDGPDSGKHTEKLRLMRVAPPSKDTVQTDSPDASTAARKAHRPVKVSKKDLHCGALEWLKSNPESYLIDAVEGISRAIKTQAGRDAFTAELNQFRSKKVRFVQRK